MKRTLLIIALIASVGAWAVPARRGGFIRTASDGTEKMVFLHGNEYFHYMTDDNGEWLDESTLAPLSAETKAARLAQYEQTKALRRAKPQYRGVGDKPNPAPRGLVIMVNFNNKSFVTPKDTIDAMHNADNFSRSYSYDRTVKYKGKDTTLHYSIKASGSARKYFQDQSYGKYNPQFDVVGPYKVSQDYSYYGSNSDANAYLMIKEACDLADNAGIDFSQYDNDNDGYVDFVYVIYAGYGEADGGGESTVWPHQSDVSGWKYKHDGKFIGRYACGCELSFYSKTYAGVGTFCHEFSHVLGLPDLYETNKSPQGNHTLFEWDVMDYGVYNNDANTPPAYSAYERFYMNWLTPRLLSEPEDVTLYPINEEEGMSLMISTTNTHNMSGWSPNPATFYLLENRKKEGWDEYLYGEGLLITKITYSLTMWKSNSVNNNASSMGVDLLEAKANTTKYPAATDAFPAGATEWTGYENHEVTDIERDSQGVITFAYRGGKQTPTENIKIDSKNNSFKILKEGKVVIIRNGRSYDLMGNDITKQ